jgi:hypothetical protein
VAVLLQNWGATADETTGQVAGDDLCADARLVATRSITITATPDDVFPWLRQMGFGRAGWYSYDWLDNLGRRSATSIDPRWQHVDGGDVVPGGPIGFEAAIVQPPRAFVLRLDATGRVSRRICFTLAYELRDDPAGTRLVTRMRCTVDAPGGRLIERFILGPGDGVMLRRQLLGISRRAGRQPSGS